MKYEVVNLKERMVEGISVKTTNTDGKGIADIGNLWQTLFTSGAYQEIEHKVNGKTIGGYTDYEGDFTKPYLFLAGAEVEKGAKNLGNRVVRVIPAGKYAKFAGIGKANEIVATLWQAIWSADIDRAYDFDFEEYQNISENMEEDQEVHIYISIK